jgi:hypothetical protein
MGTFPLPLVKEKGFIPSRSLQGLKGVFFRYSLGVICQSVDESLDDENQKSFQHHF